MKDVRINEATFPLANGGVGKLAVFIYVVKSESDL